MFRRFINQKRILVRSMSNINETPITPTPIPITHKTIPITPTPKIMYEADYMRLAKAIDENYSNLSKAIDENYSNHKDRLDNHIWYFIAGGACIAILTIGAHNIALNQLYNEVVPIKNQLNYKADKHIVDKINTDLQQLKKTHDKIAETFRN